MDSQEAIDGPQEKAAPPVGGAVQSLIAVITLRLLLREEKQGPEGQAQSRHECLTASHIHPSKSGGA